jgi:hypothetical protein
MTEMFRVSGIAFRLPEIDPATRNTKPETRNSFPQHCEPALAAEALMNNAGEG